jgi:hypothetical protein
LPDHANAALAAYRALGLALERRIPLDGWVTLILSRPARRIASIRSVGKANGSGRSLSSGRPKAGPGGPAR